MFSRTITRSTPSKPRRHARQVPHRPQVRVEIERLAQPDVDAREALADRRRHRAFERDLVRRIESISSAGSASPVRSKASDAGQRAAPTRSRRPAASRMRSDRFGDFGSDAVAGDERDRGSSWWPNRRR